MSSSTKPDANPLLESWEHEPWHMPPFSRILPEHFLPAFEHGCAEHLQELEAIVDNKAAPDFDNVMRDYDRSGSLFTKISNVFCNLCGSANSKELQVVQTAMAPILSRHKTATYTLPGLYKKIETVYESRNSNNASLGLALTAEQVRLCERLQMDFKRAGAAFSEAQQQEYGQILVELSTLETQFQQNVMKDEEFSFIVLDQADLVGLPASLVESAREAAVERNCAADEYVITLSRSLVEPFLTYSERRDLREKAFHLWTRRGELDSSRNNKEIAENILALRLKQAKLHNYETFAHYQLADTMAAVPEKVDELLSSVWQRAKVSADRERVALEKYAKEECVSLDGGIQSWDWRFYAARVRNSTYSFDESELKPYLSLEKVTAAVMEVSGRLYNLKYTHRPDIKAYHPDVQVYEVHAEDNKLVAIFLHDNLARPMKASGAWMSELRSQTRNLSPSASDIEAIPIVLNNNNFCKGEPTLLSFSDAITLFHEMGHAHHGMLSNCTYSRLASTNVLTDFLELPSQLMEHFLRRPEVLKEYALHHVDGSQVPSDLLDRREAAASFNQGFDTIEYTACAMLDLKMHSLTDYSNFDVNRFESAELQKMGMPQGIVMRHRPCHFQHLFSGSHYASSYYVYLWAEVLDADVFGAFEESSHGVFDAEVAEKAKMHIYSQGNMVAPDELFRRFRGRDPEIQFMLKKKGLE